ncbi:MAG: Tex family protein [Candidatus Tectimicrobiota bacterium]
MTPTTSDLESQQSALYTRIAAELSLQPAQVQRTVALLVDEATVPFIARYRKEATGNLDEEQIRQIEERHKYYQELEQRRKTILSTVTEQGKLTEELHAQIQACFNKVELEDLYLPYRPKRQTKASIAMERGLEPLARLLWEQQPSQTEATALAASLVAPDKGVDSVEEAFAGAGHIIAEWVAERADVRQALRAMMLAEGKVEASVAQGKKEQKTKFQDYYDFQESVATIPSHRILAILRGVREEILTMNITIDTTRAMALLHSLVMPASDPSLAPVLLAYCDDAYQRLLLPSLQTELRRTLKERADGEAITVFQGNLRSLLMAPPLGTYGILGIDPGLRTGCKVAVVDDTGKFLEYATMYPLLPRHDVAGAEQVLGDLLSRYTVKAIAVGNGTGSRETEAFVRQFLKKQQSDALCVVVNEAGASVYSASKLARQEFPELDVTIRGAISIARRLQDPLAELVKIDPKSIGVGQYQHDVDQKRLRRSLEETVESCVNRVGVDVNTASAELLQYVAGLNIRQAQNLVAYRDSRGRLTSRQQLRQVDGLGEKTFQQAAGFLRIKDGEHILDSTAVHPETYAVIEHMASSLAVPVAALVANTELINSLDLQQFVDDTVGLLTLQDIREELLKPGRDPRAQFVMPRFRDDVTTLADLQEGMVLEGAVSNVTNFGAFVDIGVHQDGLVHISELAAHYVRDPRDVVQVGQVVRVKVLGVDVALQRISLSMKGLQSTTDQPPTTSQRPASATPARRRRKKVVAAKPPVAPPPPETDMAEKLRALQARFQSPGRS